MPDAKRPLKVFLCHAHDDKSKARELYRYLKRRGLQPWLDAEDLLPGQAWQVEIPKALESSDAIIILLSKTSVDKEGYVQKEIKFALDKALEMPEGRIFLIPARLEECEVPRAISGYHWVDMFEDGGDEKLMKALKIRAEQLKRADIKTPKSSETQANLPSSPRISMVVDGLNWEFTSKSVIFDQRLRDAFPGLRSARKFDAKEAVDRLQITLKPPLIVESGVMPEDRKIIPFWWFRGTSHMYIQSFQRLTDEIFLIDKDELCIDHIVAIREFSDEKRNFVYVQSRAEEPTGMVPFISKEWLNKCLQEKLDSNHGYYFYEEYAIWNGNLISREEYDDGSALIGGKPTPIRDAKLRRRYVTPYNFVICGQDHVLNTSRTEYEQTKLLNGMLLGTKSINDLLDFVSSLPSSDRFLTL